jgi:nitrate reductase delta subunit
MLWLFKRDEGHRQALERVRQWTPARIRLQDETTVRGSEVACGMPGCPPIETVFAVWADGIQRRHGKVGQAVAEVVEDDLPPWWMKPALVVPEGVEFDCGC